MKIKRNFSKAMEEDKKNPHSYINVEIRGLSDDAAANYIDTLCAKMTEMDDVYCCKYSAVGCPDFNESEKVYFDMVSYKKEVGEIAKQKAYVGKLMTKAITAIKSK